MGTLWWYRALIGRPKSKFQIIFLKNEGVHAPNPPQNDFFISKKSHPLKLDM